MVTNQACYRFHFATRSGRLSLCGSRTPVQAGVEGGFRLALALERTILLASTSRLGTKAIRRARASKRSEALGGIGRFPIARSYAASRLSGNGRFTGQFPIGQALPKHRPGDLGEPLTIIHLPVVESEGLLVQVSERVERFDADVGAVDCALQ